MKKIILGIFLLGFFLIFSLPIKAATLNCNEDLSGRVIISEFFTGDGTINTQWIELFNIDQNNSIDLSGCSIKDGLNNNLRLLTGILPRRGFLTFTFDTAISTTKESLRLVGSDGSTTFYTVTYGDPEAVPPVSDAPSSTQSASYLAGNWILGTPTKGWCNVGFDICPSISTIVSQINAQGIATNLGSQSDYSRITGLYFQKSETTDPDGPPMGKILFLSEMNFTDIDVLTWLASLQSKIDMAIRGKIGLDADLIKDLISTNAQLTMYD